MTIEERLFEINTMCTHLELNPSRLDKEYIVKSYRDKDEQLSKDIDYVFEILSGMHKLGYKFITTNYNGNIESIDIKANISLEEFLKPLYSIEDKSELSIYNICARYQCVAHYIRCILNREWKIGINKSQVEKQVTSPMLAKKYEPNKHCKDANEEYFLTEKLDGNRCLAKYNVEKDTWEFISRSGKLLKVSFDMDNLPITYVFDGEILSRDQMSNPGQRNFNTLSGIINSIYSDEKDKLVYNIFDIVREDTPYKARRALLDEIFKDFKSNDVQLLPVIAICTGKNSEEAIRVSLQVIEEEGGEGVMVNLGSRMYEHKRTDSLLKVKSVYTMDMRVFDIEYGTGKYEDAVGSLYCVATDTDKGIIYECSVGSGLSDDQRFLWAADPEKILGKIVEVAYFSVSQDKNCEKNKYSLRFPRLKGVREDKNDESVD